jgi:Tol biopolymer transport system component
LFHRSGSDGVERYFTINTDGSGEQALFTQEGCKCAHWSPDGKRIWTLGATGHGAYSFTTIKPDGSERVVISSRIKTLSLAAGASTKDGRRIAFVGWDDTDPSRNGLYMAGPDLADLRLVMPLPKGMRAAEPFGVTADGTNLLFFGDQGSEGGIGHFGSMFVVDSDGHGLRQLNPPDTGMGFFDFPVGSLSPDGRRAAFSAGDSTHSAVFVARLHGGEAQRITDWADSGAVWAVSWSPTGEWIAYTQHHGNPNVLALVRPDGTDQRDLSPTDGTDQALAAAWAPSGKHLLAQRGGVGRRDLWIMDLNGTYLGQVTHEPSDYGTYSFSPR